MRFWITKAEVLEARRRADKGESLKSGADPIILHLMNLGCQKDMAVGYTNIRIGNKRYIFDKSTQDKIWSFSVGNLNTGFYCKLAGLTDEEISS